MHWSALGTVIPYQAIPDLHVKNASESEPPRVGRVSTRRSSRAAQRDARAIRALQQGERERVRAGEEGEPTEPNGLANEQDPT